MMSPEFSPDDPETRQYAVITGASSGIGEAFARTLAKEGYSLILCARREEKLKRLVQEVSEHHHELDKGRGRDIIVCADLEKVDGIRKLTEAVDGIIKEGCRLSVFISCAGFGLAGAFDETDLDRELSMIDLNIKAVHILMKHVLAIYEKQGSGTLLNVASSAGLFPGGPYLSTYYATKSYVCSLTRAAVQEYKEKKSNIYIACLCPGPVDTEFNEVAKVSFALRGISAEACVEYCMKMMKRKKIVIIPGSSIRAAVFFARFLPSALLLRMTANQQKKKLYRRTVR